MLTLAEEIGLGGYQLASRVRKAFLSLPDVRRLLAIALVMRMPVGMMSLGMLMHSRSDLLIVQEGSMTIPAARIMKAEDTEVAIQTVIGSIHTLVRRIPLTCIAE